MKRVRLLLALFMLACQSREEQLQTRITDETSRLEKQLASIDRKKLPEDVAGLATGYRDSFARIRDTKSPALGLYRLRDTFIGIETLAFFAANRAAGDDMNRLNALIAQRRPAYDPKGDPSAGPLLHRALIEQAANRARVLYRASAPYGKISDPMWGGLFYLGQAEGNLRFRDFVASLPDHGDEARPDHQRMLAVASRLEQETLSVFRKDARAAIRPSAKLKEARELLAAGLDDGAALALVETRSALNQQGDIPAMLQSFIGEAAPPMKVVANAPATVTVTLVRWPYT